MLASWTESYGKPGQHIKKQGHHFAYTTLYSQAMVFPVVIYMAVWELDPKKSWALKKWLFQMVVLGKTLESPLDSKEIKPINPKGNKSWIFIGRTDAEALILWPPDAKSWLIGKVPDAGKYWGQKEKRASEDEMAGWHHWCNRHELQQTSGDNEGQRGLACCSPWGCKMSDMTGRLNDNTTSLKALFPNAITFRGTRG